jgi:putative tryptophan/tyrosine transport system substrate-binding protein
MRRRDLVQLVGGTATASLLFATAGYTQPPGKLSRVGIIVEGGRTPAIDGFLQGMDELGYVAGRDYVADWRIADGRFTRFGGFAQDFVRLRVDVILLETAAALDTVRQVTRSIPVVVCYFGPAAGAVHTGANITGVSRASGDLSSKQFELLKAAVPNLLRVGVLLNHTSAEYSEVLAKTRAAAENAGIALVWTDASSPQAIDRAFAIFTNQRVEAVMVTDDRYFFTHQEKLVALALRHRLPSIFPRRDYVQAGGLMSYGENKEQFYRRAASLVDKIFKGSKPGDLPIETVPSQLAINRGSAAALGLTIPLHVYAQASEIIE